MAFVGKAFIAYFYRTIHESTDIFSLSTAWRGAPQPPGLPQEAAPLIYLRATTFSLFWLELCSLILLTH